MTALLSVWHDFRDAARAFTPQARRFLLAEFLAWLGHGIFQVLFNLYLVEGGFQESFVGRAVSFNAVGLALMALPAGLLADRWGRTRSLVLGAVIDGAAQLLRASTLDGTVVLAASFGSGVGQSMLAIAAAPFITEHSSPRERTHLFSAFFATALLAGVVGAMLGGWIPVALRAFPGAFDPGNLAAYRIALVIGGLFVLAAALPLIRVARSGERPAEPASNRVTREDLRLLAPTGMNALLVGAGAGLVIPFMNLYFARRFACSSAQIGSFFSAAQVVTAFASLLAPAVARRFGKLRTAVASQLLSLPFLVTLGFESHLSIAVAAFLMRATLMQASTPLMNAFVMEVLPVHLRARSSSLINLAWNIGWAVSATFAGLIIERFGYSVPFYCTAALYALAATSFYMAFRGRGEDAGRPPRPRDMLERGEAASGP
ncbi:MAG: MFS transporter [Candidatus Eisenbacteria bacterium]